MSESTTVTASGSTAFEGGPAPVVVGPNQPLERPYRGGAGIAAFRGTTQPGDYAPEDFVGSTTEVHAGGGVGLTVLPDGRRLRDAVAADPIGWLGRDHVDRYGAETMLLVKLLDTAERLFVHFHPGDAFAGDVLGEPRGKTEAWTILDVRPGVEGFAAIGFTRDISTDEAVRWFDEQDVDAMLAAMHRVPLHPGDTLLVPAGIPHAIGPGITLVELQQPADLSILLEYRGYRGLGVDDALLGMDRKRAIDALDRSAWTPERISGLSRPARKLDQHTDSLFPFGADAYFRAERVLVSGVAPMDRGFSILVVVGGIGVLHWAGGDVHLERGMTIVVPFAAAELTLTGDLDVIRARPPKA